MNNLLQKIKTVQLRWFVIPALALAAGITFLAGAVGTPPSIPAISLSSDPLYAASGGDKPAMALALSVEFPTVGAQYVNEAVNSSDSSYANTKEYLGYYDAESCYNYNNAPTETRVTGFSVTDYKRFDRAAAAINRMCADAFSGNFLNWASSSAIDMLRLALSGGDRYIDTATNTATPTLTNLTVLQRAVVPNGDPTCMWNNGNFPAKQLQKNGFSAGAYWGAVPLTMRTEAGVNDIWVANTLNRIYFRGGSGVGGSCVDTTPYTLGSGTPAVGIGPIASFNSTALPADAAAGFCANENANCAFVGTKEVWYGAKTKWKVAPAADGVQCRNSVFGDPISSTAKKCYVRPYTGAWGTGGAGLNTDGFFYARVQVCDSSAIGALLDNRDYNLCTRYPNGNFKPTGTIQKYSDSLRLAALGYVIDQTRSAEGGRYGGVLRAPMKYVGAKTFDINGQDNTPGTGNPNAEWNLNTGVFAPNPDGDTTQATPISGVINYLNKFGRTGPVAGRYKMHDPVGELHYQALRYLQGLPPSTASVASLTADMYDGFPVSTTWTDPYGNGRSNTANYSCLKSNIIVVGDVNTWDGNRRPIPNVANNIPDLSYWQDVAYKFESNTNSGYTDGQGGARTTANPNTANTNVATGISPAEVVGSAYWAHTHDIRGTDWTASPSLQRPGLRVKSFFFDVNEGARSNDTGYRRTQNQFFTAAKYGGFESDAANAGGKPFNTFGNPFKNQSGVNDNVVWENPTAPGEAGAYYLQSNARGVLSAFDSIFNRASSAARSIAGSAVQSTNLTTAGTSIYQGAFDTAGWTGDVISIPVSVNGSNTVTISSTNNWSAADRLGLLTSPQTTRKIVVGRTGAAASPVASAFSWSAIDTDLKTQLSKTSPTAVTDTLGEDRLNYLRGDRSREGSLFRTRSKLLGDIVNSGIAYSGTPTTSLTNNDGYGGFLSANISRAPAVFVGANDGMMHAFNANNGDELFAYIPSWLGPKLSLLANTTYINNHQSYVDSTPVVAEAKIGVGSTASDWKTVLVSGTGAGGPGVFALDVTNPVAFTTTNALWEFTKADDADMGFVVGQPRIVKMRTSTPTAVPTYRWFAAVASGVNNYVADGAGLFSSTGNPALFLLALDKPVGAAWTAMGSTPNYYKIVLPIDSTLSTTMATGLINFRPIFGTQGEVTQIFMGDLHGKLWKLDFSLRDTSQWQMGKLSSFNRGTVGAPIPYPLFVATTAAGVPQPISMAPTVLAGPDIGNIQTRYIAFGTGKYLESTDKISTAISSLYAVYDNGSTAADNSPVGSGAISGRGRLKAGGINTTTGIITVPPFTWGRAISDSDLTQRSGWYFDFQQAGERQISSATVFGDEIVFGSLIPAATGTSGSCSASGGGGVEYRINIDTGNGSSAASNVGLLGQPLVIELAGNVEYKVSNSTGRRLKIVSKTTIQQGSTGISSSNATATTFVAGRLSWRQINNYQDLKAAP